jgi:hypothetical protein
MGGMPLALPISFREDKMAKSGRQLLALFSFFLILAFLYGCGEERPGGEWSGGSELLPSKMVIWNPPATYQDGSSLDPATDLDNYEIYVKEAPNFADTDDEMATLSATDRATGQVCTTFNLANLAPFISKGVTYYVSIRAVAKNGLKSDFSPIASFSF